MEGARATSPACSRNSSRKSLRSDFADREYRANSAPLTTSGRLTRANTGPSRLVKWGARRARSSAVNGSVTKSKPIALSFRRVVAMLTHRGDSPYGLELGEEVGEEVGDEVGEE